VEESTSRVASSPESSASLATGFDGVASSGVEAVVAVVAVVAAVVIRCSSRLMAIGGQVDSDAAVMTGWMLTAFTVNGGGVSTVDVVRLPRVPLRM